MIHLNEPMIIWIQVAWVQADVIHTDESILSMMWMKMDEACVISFRANPRFEIQVSRRWKR
jgi:hypothetical protein